MNDIQTVKDYIKKHQHLNYNKKIIIIQEIQNIELDIEKYNIQLYDIENDNNKLSHYLKEMISFNNQLQEGIGTNLFTTTKINEYKLKIELNNIKIDEIKQSIQDNYAKSKNYQIEYPIFYNSKPPQKNELKFI
jgi:hypothetical protein